MLPGTVIILFAEPEQGSWYSRGRLLEIVEVEFRTFEDFFENNKFSYNNSLIDCNNY